MNPRRLFRPLGARLRNFGRSLMRHYLPSTTRVSPTRSDPNWMANTETDLNWGDDAPDLTGLDESLDSPSEFAPEVENTPRRSAQPRPTTRPSAPPVAQRQSTPAAPAGAAPPPAATPSRPRPKDALPNIPVSHTPTNPILLEALEADRVRKARREEIVARQMASLEQSQSSEADNEDDVMTQLRRRRRASVDYVATDTLVPPEERGKVSASKPAATDSATATTVDASSIQRSEADASEIEVDESPLERLLSMPIDSVSAVDEAADVVDETDLPESSAALVEWSSAAAPSVDTAPTRLPSVQRRAAPDAETDDAPSIDWMDAPATSDASLPPSEGRTTSSSAPRVQRQATADEPVNEEEAFDDGEAYESDAQVDDDAGLAGAIISPSAPMASDQPIQRRSVAPDAPSVTPVSRSQPPVIPATPSGEASAFSSADDVASDAEPTRAASPDWVSYIANDGGSDAPSVTDEQPVSIRRQTRGSNPAPNPTTTPTNVPRVGETADQSVASSDDVSDPWQRVEAEPTMDLEWEDEAVEEGEETYPVSIGIVDNAVEPTVQRWSEVDSAEDSAAVWDDGQVPDVTASEPAVQRWANAESELVDESTWDDTPSIADTIASEPVVQRWTEVESELADATAAEPAVQRWSEPDDQPIDEPTWDDTPNRADVTAAEPAVQRWAEPVNSIDAPIWADADLPGDADGAALSQQWPEADVDADVQFDTPGDLTKGNLPQATRRSQRSSPSIQRAAYDADVPHLQGDIVDDQSSQAASTDWQSTPTAAPERANPAPSNRLQRTPQDEMEVAADYWAETLSDQDESAASAAQDVMYETSDSLSDDVSWSSDQPGSEALSLPDVAPTSRPQARSGAIQRRAAESPMTEDDMSEEGWPEQPMDLFQALSHDHYVTDTPKPSSSSPFVQRQVASDDDEVDEDVDMPPMDLFQALANESWQGVSHNDAGPVQRAPMENTSVSRSAIPEQPIDLYQALMGQTPDAPSDGSVSITGHAAGSETVRRAEPSGGSADQPSSESGEQGGGDVDVEKLARDVYSVLKNRLRIERERSNRW